MQPQSYETRTLTRIVRFRSRALQRRLDLVQGASLTTGQIRRRQALALDPHPQRPPSAP